MAKYGLNIRMMGFPNEHIYGENTKKRKSHGVKFLNNQMYFNFHEHFEETESWWNTVEKWPDKKWVEIPMLTLSLQTAMTKLSAPVSPHHRPAPIYRIRCVPGCWGYQVYHRSIATTQGLRVQYTASITDATKKWAVSWRPFFKPPLNG